MSDNVASRANKVIALVVARGNTISLAAARRTAVAVVYLRERELRVPLTLEQARALDSEALQQCRAYCAGWKEWADAAFKALCERTLELLMSVEQEAAEFTGRRALEPICGWADRQRRGAYTKAHWRQAA